MNQNLYLLTSICLLLLLPLSQLKGQQAYKVFAKAEKFRYERKLDSALWAFELARKSYEADKQLDSTQLCLKRLGDMYRLKREHELALGYYQQTLQLNKTTHSNQLDAEILNQMGLVYEDQHKYQEAIQFLWKALQLKEAELGSSHPFLESSYNNIGECHKAMGEYADARENFLQALKVARANQRRISMAVFCVNIGESYRLEGDFEQARLYYEKGFDALGDKGVPPTLEAAFHLEYARFYLDQAQADSALQQAQAAIQLSIFHGERYPNHPSLDAVRSKGSLLSALQLKADALEQLNEWKEASQSWQLAVQLIDTIRNDLAASSVKLLLAEETFSVYEGAIRVALKLYEQQQEQAFLEQAFAYSEKSKSTLLFALIRESLAKNIGGIPDEILAKESQQKEEIALTEKMLRKATFQADANRIDSIQLRLFDQKKAYYQLVQSLETQYPAYYNLKYKLQTVSMETLQQELIRENECMLEYFVGNKEIVVFGISRTDAWVWKHKKGQDWEERVRKFRASLTDLNAIYQKPEQVWQDFTREAHFLYEQLIPTEKLRACQRILLIPDGILGYIPFGVLLENEVKSPTRNYAELPYLLRKYPIRYGYSATILHEFTSNEKTEYELDCAAFAPSVRRALPYETGANARTMPPLPASQQELEGISRHLSGRFLYDEAATESSFRQAFAHSRVLHLSMHTLLDDQLPMQSRLIFSADGDSLADGLLYAYELYNLKTSAELAVLSACETGSGRLQQGEGIMSLSRAFMYAGCKSIVMSLWLADDYATSEMMDAFYANLANSCSQDEAIRQARLAYLAKGDPDFSHPFFWAAFVPIGQANPIQVRRLWWVYWVALGGIVIAIGLFYLKRKG